MVTLTNYDRLILLDELQEAQEKLFEVIEAVQHYVHVTKDMNAKAYLLDHLKIMASN